MCHCVHQRKYLSVRLSIPSSDGCWATSGSRDTEMSLAPLSVFHELTSGQPETNRDRADQSEAKDTEVWPIRGQKEIWTMRWVFVANECPWRCLSLSHCTGPGHLSSLKWDMKGPDFKIQVKQAHLLNKIAKCIKIEDLKIKIFIWEQISLLSSGVH